MTEWIIEILSWVMRTTHLVTHHWAVDIVLLTILVRLAMYPLNKTMNRNLKLMQKVQPEMKEVQEKYKGKPEELNKRMMEIYKKYKINPAASCLPLVIQMPIFFALFKMLRDAQWYLRLPGFEDATLFGINLTIPPQITHPYPEIALKAGVLDLYSVYNNPWLADRFLYLPTLWLLVGYIVTMILQTKMMQSTTQASSPGQPNTMALMMPMFIFFGLFFPVGLLAYFITSNVLQIGTYWRIKREAAQEEAAEGDAIPDRVGTPVSSNKMNFFKLDNLFSKAGKPDESPDSSLLAKDDSVLKKEVFSKSNTDQIRKGKKKKKK